MQEHTFVPIRPEEPFRYLEQLKDAFLETQEGRKGAVLPPKQEETSAPEECNPESQQPEDSEKPTE